MRKYIEGEPRQADEHTVLLPEWLEEAIIHLGMDEAKGLKLFGNQLLKRHFGEYCQRMQEMFPGWFGIETVDIYHFKKSELYLTESEIGPVAKKVPEILNEETEKMVGFILAAKGEIPENIGAARPIKSAMFNKVRKVCTLMDHIQDRHAELTGNKTRAGHAARSGYIEVYCPVLDKIDRAILDKELETSV